MHRDKIMPSIKTRIFTAARTNIIGNKRTEKTGTTFYSGPKPRTKIRSNLHSSDNYTWVNGKCWCNQTKSDCNR